MLPDTKVAAAAAATPPSARRNLILESGAVSQAFRDLRNELGADVDLLDVLPFSRCSIRKHNDQIASKRRALDEKIRVGTIEDESGTASPLWAYLLDNIATNGATEIAYYSFGRRGKAMRHKPEDAHEATLRPEFQHCGTPSVLTATAKYYLYKKGVAASYPIHVSKHLAKEIVRSCKDYREANHIELEVKGGDAMDFNSISAEDQGESRFKREPWYNLGHATPTPTPTSSLPQYFDTPMAPMTKSDEDSARRGFRSNVYELYDQTSLSDGPHGFTPYTPLMTPLHAADQSHEPISLSPRPSLGAQNTLGRSSTTYGSVEALQTARERERQIGLAVYHVQQRLDLSKQSVSEMRTKQNELEAEWKRIETAINAEQVNASGLEKELDERNTQIAASKEEQERILNANPQIRAMIELGRQMERSSQN